MANKEVNFNDPTSVAAAIAEAETAEATKAEAKAEAKTGAPNAKKPRVIKVTYTADKDIKKGETIEFEYTLPVSAGSRGILAGKKLEDMTDDELKIEYRNASSVLYKQQKAGNKDTTKAQARVDAVIKRMEEKGISVQKRAAAVPVTAESVAALIKAGKLSAEDIQKLLDGSAE